MCGIVLNADEGTPRALTRYPRRSRPHREVQHRVAWVRIRRDEIFHERDRLLRRVNDRPLAFGSFEVDDISGVATTFRPDVCRAEVAV